MVLCGEEAVSEWPFTGLEKGKYGAILADPPWRFETYNEKGRQKSPDWRTAKGMPMHYQTMATGEIAALPVSDIAAPDCALFMWISWPMLPHALGIIDVWGFVYKTCGFAWFKGEALPMFPEDMRGQMGCGYWTRANSEACLLATRGKPKRLNADVRQAILEPRREHSRKPDCVHERIERLVSGPYCELFARARRPGWDCWGNQVDKFTVAA